MTTKTQKLSLKLGNIPDLWPNLIISPLELIDAFIENAKINVMNRKDGWNLIVVNELNRFKEQMISLNIGDR